MAPRGQDVSKKPDEARKPEGKDEKPAALPQAVPEHHWQCNQEFHARKEVVSSQEKFPWKVPPASCLLPFPANVVSPGDRVLQREAMDQLGGARHTGQGGSPSS